MGLILSALVIGFLSSVLANELKDWTPSIVQQLIKCAVSFLPKARRARFHEEWNSYVADVPGDLAKLLVAFGFVIAAYRMSVNLNWVVYRSRIIDALNHLLSIRFSMGALSCLLALSAVMAIIMPQTEAPAFNGDHVPIPVRLFAESNASCSQWDKVIEGIKRGKYHIKLRINGPCVAVTPASGLRDIETGTVALVLGSSNTTLGAPGVSGEYRSAGGRRFFVIVDSRATNSLTVVHELRHILDGHTAVQIQSPMIKPLANVLLDLVVSMDMLLGRNWPQFAIAFWLVGLVLCLRLPTMSGKDPPSGALTILDMHSKS